MATTRWRLVSDDGMELGILESAAARMFVPGDWLNIPPPPDGTVWTVLSVEEMPDYEGRLILGDPTPATSRSSYIPPRY
jgi:hypothetical protein